MKHKYGVVRSVDVARYMGFSKPSISHAVKELRKKEYLCLDDSGNLVLTDKGIEMASKTYEKHCFFKKSFIDVGVDPQVAEKEACKIARGEQLFLFMVLIRELGVGKSFLCLILAV